MTSNALELKAEYLPFTIVKLIDSDKTSIDNQLADITRQAPNYFDGTPVVIDVTSLQQMLSADTLTYVTDALKQHKMVPAGIKGVSEKSKALVVEQGLPIINHHQMPARQTSKQESKPESHTTTKVVTKPLRSGSQVYAKNGDLIILSSVNAGAECIADGNIHIYGPLRGRALAGARGDKSARIFCHQLDAELVSIAGYFLTQEQIQVPTTNAPMTQIYWQNEQLTIESI